MLKAVIFDVDGTLVDSVDCHAKAWQDAFQEFGHEFPFDRIRSQIGKGGDQLMPEFLNKAEIDETGKALEARRGDILKERYLSQITAFPMVRELFEKLHASGIKAILASSAKSDELGTYKRLAGITDLVDAETSSDDAERSKPHGDIFAAALARIPKIDPEDVIVIGDTPWDAIAATKARLRTIGVRCGGFADTDLQQAGVVAIFDGPADLLACFTDWQK